MGGRGSFCKRGERVQGRGAEGRNTGVGGYSKGWVGVQGAICGVSRVCNGRIMEEGRGSSMCASCYLLRQTGCQMSGNCAICDLLRRYSVLGSVGLGDAVFCDVPEVCSSVNELERSESGSYPHLVEVA
eukprot:767572-Hanusia_phi.AAC.1